jgi:hypothetical protein
MSPVRTVALASSWSLETNTTLRPTSSGNGLPGDALHIRACATPIGSRLKTDFGLTHQLGPLHRVAQAYRRAKRHEVKRAYACQSTFPMRATRTQLRC